MAVSRDGVGFDKLGMVVDCPDGLRHFRDPKVWRADGVGYMVFGACSADNRGEVWLYTSADMRSWSFDRVLYRDPDPDTFMLECPDVFPLGDRWVISYCPMGRAPAGYQNRNMHNAGYVVGNWAPGREFEQLTDFRPTDWGANFYAPQSLCTVDGRRVMFGWMGSFGIPVASAAEDGWAGQLSVPRHVRLDEDTDRLISTPIAELDRLRVDTREFGALRLEPNTSKLLIEDFDGAAEVQVDIDLARSGAERVGLAVNKTPDGHRTLVGYDDLAGRVFIDRRDSGHGDRGYRAAPCAGDRLRLRVLIDRDSVEVFVNDGVETVSSLTFAADGPRAIELYTESGVAVVDALAVHRLGSIWDESTG